MSSDLAACAPVSTQEHTHDTVVYGFPPGDQNFGSFAFVAA